MVNTYNMNVYMITNTITGKSYIGKQQNDIETYMGSGLLLWNSYRKRFNNPLLNDNCKSHHKWVYNQNQKLHIYNKIILDTTDSVEELCELEKYYIKKYNTLKPNGYNIAEGGQGGCLIKGYTEEEKNNWKQKISQQTQQAMQRPDVKQRFMDQIQNRGNEWKQRISKSLTGRKGTPLTEEQKEDLRILNLGNTYGLGNKSRTGQHNSEEMNRKISIGQKQIVHTKEWNERVSQSLKGKKKTEAHKQALRKPKPKYKWLLPDGTIKIMDAGNGSKHEGWIRQEKI